MKIMFRHKTDVNNNAIVCNIVERCSSRIYLKFISWLILTFQDGQTPFLVAVHLGNMDLITVLIENGADINSPALDVRKSSVPNSFCYISYALNVYQYSYDNLHVILFVQQGDTPMITATKKERIDIVIQLLDCGADSSCKDKVSNLRSN